LYREAFRAKLSVMLEHRLFYIPSFKIYGARRAGYVVRLPAS